jgi:glycerate 2-kinase
MVRLTIMKLLSVATSIIMIPASSRTLAWVGVRYYCNCRCYFHNYNGSTILEQLVARRQSSSITLTSSFTRDKSISVHSLHRAKSVQRTFQEIQMTDDITKIVKEAIRAVDPVVAVQRCVQLDIKNSNQPVLQVVDRQKNENDVYTNAILKSYDLYKYENIIVVGIGKAAAAMVLSVLETIGPAIIAMDSINQSTTIQRTIPKVSGIALTKFGHITDVQRIFLESKNIVVREASHPIPCEVGVSASYELLNMVSDSTNQYNNNKLVIACISGGGSALFCTPRHPLSLDDLKATNTALLQTGWPISSINLIRTALEYGKGGGLAEAVIKQSSSEIVSFILSDVVGDPLDLIASGPTVIRSNEMIQSAIQDANELLRDSTPPHIQFPKAVIDFLANEYENLSLTSIDANIDSEDLCHRSFNCLVGNNAVAVEAAAGTAIELGYHPIILGTQLQGEASTVAQILVGLAQNIQQPTTLHSINHSGTYPIALIVGGETTVTLPSDDDNSSKGGIGSCLGGRNQELALAAALALYEKQIRQIVIASVGTDGNDGPTDAAGAIVDGRTVCRMDAISASDVPISSSSNLIAKIALQSHNAYPYFNRTDAYGHSPLLKVGTN